MLEKKLEQYISGYIVIEVSGKFIERFINISVFQRLKIWDITKLDNEKMEMKVSRRDYFKLKPIANTANVKFSLSKKHGIFNEFSKMKRHIFLSVGILLTILAIIFASKIIWKVEFIGESEFLTTQMREQLEDSLTKNQIAIFRYANIENGEYLRDVLLEENKFLSWIWVSIDGSKAIVDLRLKTPPPVMVEKEIPADIIATKAGVVTMIIPRAGMKKVEVNSTIEKGDILISGAIESEYIDTRIVCARGDVFARTWYEETGKISNKKSEKTFTGNEKTIKQIKIGKKTINLSFNSSILYAKYDTIENKDITVLPTITFSSITYKEYEIVERTLSDDECKKLLKEKLQKQTKAKLSQDNRLVAQDFVCENVGNEFEGKLCSEYIEKVSESVDMY